MPIDPTAYVDKTAIVAESANIGYRAYVGKNCIIGENVEIGVNAIVECHTEIGDGTVIYTNAHIGGAPQDFSYKNEDTKLKIGKNCTIREMAPIHRGTTKDDWVTEIGDNTWISAQAHIAHDCKIGNDVFIGSATLAGHVHVDDYAFISGILGVHQGVHIGKMAMIAAITRTTKDVPPYCMISGADKTQISGLNVVAMRRRGVSSAAMKELKRALHIYMDKSLLFEQAKEKLKELEQLDEIITFRNFIERESPRGFVRA